MVEPIDIKPMTTGRYWFTSPECQEPQVLWYSAATNTIMILGMSYPVPLDASIKIIGPCQFITVRIDHKYNDQDSFVGASANGPPVIRQKSPVQFYDIEINMDKHQIRFVTAAKTYEKRPGYEESTEFEISTTCSGTVMMHPIGSSRMTKRTPQNDVGEFGF